MYIFKAGVVGAGAMGAGIAQVISYSGLPVVLKDVDQAMLDKGMAHIRSIYEGRVEKGKMSAGEMQSKLDLITPTLDYGEFADVDIVVEAVPEKMSLKQRIFQDLDKVYPNIGIDSYPNTLRSSLEQPTRHALTLESDPMYVTGWGAGNLVSDPTRRSSSEDLSAQYGLKPGDEIQVQIGGRRGSAFVAGLLHPSAGLSRRAFCRVTSSSRSRGPRRMSLPPSAG